MEENLWSIPISELEKMVGKYKKYETVLFFR